MDYMISANKKVDVKLKIEKITNYMINANKKNNRFYI